MFKKVLSITISLLVFLTIFTSSSYEAKMNNKVVTKVQKKTTPNYLAVNTIKSNNPKGTWLWNAYLIINNGAQIVDYLKNNGFTEIYVKIDEGVAKEDYAKFIEIARNNNIDVFALDGNANWIYKDKQEGLIWFVDWMKEYNKYAKENQKFKGMHLDVEPYVLPEWNTNKNLLIKYYQEFLLNAYDKAKIMGLEFAADIPFWFDEINFNNEYGKGNLAEWIIKKVDAANIMAYRDSKDAIINITKNEMEYARRYNKKIMISVETSASSEGNNITFYEEGINYMWSETAKVTDYFNSFGVNFGLAVHHLVNLNKF